jgi:hypothetical protein
MIKNKWGAIGFEMLVKAVLSKGTKGMSLVLL